MKAIGKTITALATITCLLSSCSQDNSEISERVDNSMIRFNAVTPQGLTRTAATTTASLQSFVVYAFTEKKMLMDNVTVTRDGTSWTYSPTAYWSSTPVNFFAFSPDISHSPDILGDGTASINMFENPGNIDLLYAVNYGEIQKGTPVMINFRHALAKVDVLLSSNNANLEVKVGKVTLGNIYTIGSFTYPKATTAAATPEVTGKWGESSLRQIENIVLFHSGTNPVTLQPTPVDLGEGENSIDFFIPQALAPLSYDAANSVLTGTYIAVDCEICDKNTGAVLFPTEMTPDYLRVPGSVYGRILYPLTNSAITSWQQGNYYIYNITMNNPAVLLDGIDFNVTVDQYNENGMEENLF